MTRFASLGSGSEGNALGVRIRRQRVLLDCASGRATPPTAWRGWAWCPKAWPASSSPRALRSRRRVFSAGQEAQSAGVDHHGTLAAVREADPLADQGVVTHSSMAIASFPSG